MNYEEMPKGEQPVEKTTLETEEQVISKEVAPEAAEEIKKEETAGLETARKELAGFDKEQTEKQESNFEKFGALAEQKIAEMEAEINSKKPSDKDNFFKKALKNLSYDEDRIKKANLHIANAKALLAKGTLPDMHSLKKNIGIVESVDISEFPENPNKKYGSSGHIFGSGY